MFETTLPRRCMLLQTVLFLCLFCKGTVSGQSSVSVTVDTSSALPESPSFSPMLLPTSTLSSSQQSATPSSTTVAIAMATPVPLKQYVIILGVTTGVFLVTTVLSTAILVIICCRKHRAVTRKTVTTDGVFNGSPGSSHWLAQPSANQQKTESESLGITDLPIWSTGTFSDPVRSNTYNAEQPQPQPTISINGILCENTEQPVPAKNSKARSKITPKRVAPPPPKGKKRKKSGGEIDDSVVYDVPASNRWYSRKKRPSKTQYKELNLNQLQAPSHYAKPLTAT